MRNFPKTFLFNRDLTYKLSPHLLLQNFTTRHKSDTGFTQQTKFLTIITSKWQNMMWLTDCLLLKVPQHTSERRKREDGIFLFLVLFGKHVKSWENFNVARILSSSRSLNSWWFHNFFLTLTQITKILTTKSSMRYCLRHVLTLPLREIASWPAENFSTRS